MRWHASCGRFRHRELFGLLSFGLGHTYSESTGPDNMSVTSDSLLFWLSDYSTNHKGWMLCAEVVSAVDDPHVSTVTRESFDLWRT